ncbi:MAG: Rhodanese protein [Gemmatimonadetes bacterium]|jgi:rhodanese-related sulfurtransferase|nr:Rhodanese protein [Gemmatimonadota bacterium]
MDATDTAAAPQDPVPRITREELVTALASAQPPALFEVLPPGYWRKSHLPGAINAPPSEAVAIITAQVPHHDADIVVYCWDPG